jgi:hypothetical protein
MADLVLGTIATVDVGATLADRAAHMLAACTLLHTATQAANLPPAQPGPSWQGTHR